MAKRKVKSDELFQAVPVWQPGWLTITGVRHNNLKSIDVSFPLSAFTAVTGVSGSGKSSLVEDVLYKALAARLNHAQTSPGSFDELRGIDQINKVIEVDQKPLGQTPTSNPATYTGLFDLIRQLFAQLPDAKLRGYTARRFSFNVPGGRCEKCQGAGMVNIEMHFLADVWITCDECHGKRYERQTLEIKYRGHSISDILEMSCKDALALFANIPKIARILRTLCDVGLDYITLGQSATTLSGGEAQRVKLATELARPDTGRTLYILDEPTTGLHFDDLQKLLEVLHRLVDLGNTVIVIEHNMEIIKSVDWVIEIGPEAGLEGGRLVYAGSPEQMAAYANVWLSATPKKQKSMLRCYTGEALIPILNEGLYCERPVFDAKEYARELEKINSEELVPEEELIEANAALPWEVDGRRWHTHDRIGRNGADCKWDGRVLEDVMDRIEESDFFAPADWSNRTIVEVRSDKKSLGWFLHAITGEEWLLKLKFRVPKNTFKKDLLVQQLNLRPLNELDDIPLYGTHPRVKVDTTGPWQEVELKIYSYQEIDHPGFWNFLDLAISQFGHFTGRVKENDVDLTPWKSLGEKWHTTPGNCYGESVKPKWKMEILENIIRILAESFPKLKPVWSNKILVPYLDARKKTCCQIYTKNCEHVCLQLNVVKNSLPLGSILKIGIDPEVDGSNPAMDSVYLRFLNNSDLNEDQLKSILNNISFPLF